MSGELDTGHVPGQAPGHDLDWPCAHGGPAGHGRLRVSSEDFFVEEDLGFAPDGEGSHALLFIEKRDTNTDWLARRLGQFAEVKPVDVGYAGLKDRNAVTRQWFSVQLGNRPDPDWSGFEEARVLEAHRHGRKLRRGALRGNRFEIRVRELEGEREAMAARLAALREQGAPNYFGEQRFGRDGGNLRHAERMLVGGRRVHDRHKRGLYLSAARSLLFNRVLAARVTRGDWATILPGEVAMLAGSRSFFRVDAVDEEILQRVARWDIHPSGPMWGRGTLADGEEALAVVHAALSGLEGWQNGLEHAGLEQERRALRLGLPDLEWSFVGDDVLEVRFSLPAGSYATTVLREVVHELLRNDGEEPIRGETGA